MFSYYGMFMWLPSILVSKGNSFVSSFGYTTLMVVAQLPGYFGAAWLTKHVRLRYIFSIYMLGTALGAVMFGPLLVGFLMDKGVSINSIFILFMVSLIAGAIAVLALPDENLSKDGQNHAE